MLVFELLRYFWDEITNLNAAYVVINAAIKDVGFPVIFNSADAGQARDLCARHPAAARAVHGLLRLLRLTAADALRKGGAGPRFSRDGQPPPPGARCTFLPAMLEGCAMPDVESRRVLLRAWLAPPMLSATMAIRAAPALLFDVELRWVVVRWRRPWAGVRDGATVIGTQGAVSPRAGEAKVLSTGTQNRARRGPGQPGGAGRCSWAGPTACPGTDRTAIEPGLCVGAGRPGPARPTVGGTARGRLAERPLRLAVRPRSAGAGQPITLSLEVAAPDGSAVQTQLALPEGHWQRVASLQIGVADPAPAGTWPGGDAVPVSRASCRFGCGACFGRWLGRRLRQRISARNRPKMRARLALAAG